MIKKRNWLIFMFVSGANIMSNLMVNESLINKKAAVLKRLFSITNQTYYTFSIEYLVIKSIAVSTILELPKNKGVR